MECTRFSPKIKRFKYVLAVGVVAMWQPYIESANECLCQLSFIVNITSFS